MKYSVSKIFDRTISLVVLSIVLGGVGLLLLTVFDHSRVKSEVKQMIQDKAEYDRFEEAFGKPVSQGRYVDLSDKVKERIPIDQREEGLTYSYFGMEAINGYWSFIVAYSKDDEPIYWGAVSDTP